MKNYKKYIGKKYAVYCPTQECWDRVKKVLMDERINYGIAPWNQEKEYFYVCCDDGGTVSYKCISYLDYTILTISEFFEGKVSERINFDRVFIDEYTDFSQEDTVKRIKQYMDNNFNAQIEYNKLISTPLFKTNNIIKKGMNKIQTFIRDSKLSKEDKLLIKYDCTNHDGKWLKHGISIILDMEAQEFGYKNFSDALSKFSYDNGFCIDEISPFTMHKLVEKYKPELIKTLEKMEKEEE